MKLPIENFLLMMKHLLTQPNPKEFIQVVLERTPDGKDGEIRQGSHLPIYNGRGEMLKILITYYSTHPHYGGDAKSIYEYLMKDAVRAEEKYIELQKLLLSSGGYEHISIAIVDDQTDSPH